MKKLFVLLSFFLINSGAHEARAIDLGVNASYWDTDEGDGALGYGAQVGFPFIVDHLHLEARAYKFEDDGGALFGDVDITPIDAGLAFFLTLDEPVNPYLIAGVSYFYVDSEDLDLDSDFGYYGGAGLDFDISNGFRLVGEAIFRSAEFDSDAGFDESFDTTGVTFNIGLRYRL